MKKLFVVFLSIIAFCAFMVPANAKYTRAFMHRYWYSDYSASSHNSTGGIFFYPEDGLGWFFHWKGSCAYSSQRFTIKLFAYSPDYYGGKLPYWTSNVGPYRAAHGMRYAAEEYDLTWFRARVNVYGVNGREPNYGECTGELLASNGGT